MKAAWIRNEAEAFARCDHPGCGYEYQPLRDYRAAAMRAARRHHEATGHEIRVEVSQTIWLEGEQAEGHKARKAVERL